MDNSKYNFLLDLRVILSAENIGLIKCRNLIEKFGTPSDVLNSSTNQLCAVDGISTLLAENIHKAQNRRKQVQDKLDRELADIGRVNATCITLWDDEYPLLLKRIYDPPLVIYIKGAFSAADDYSLAMVGTRFPSAYGKNNAKLFSEELVKQNLTIVSGLARGIDTIAHTSALDAGGRTIAVLGSGIDNIYPPENRKLAERIVSSGVIISEFEPKALPDGVNFPRRNRIIAGLSLGSLIVESGLKGGSLYTANFAISQNREVFSIPGNINQPSSGGTNKLIQEGSAKLVTSVDDILSEIALPWNTSVSTKSSKKKDVVELDMFESAIVNAMGLDPVHIDVIAKEANVTPGDCLVYLFQLEMKNVIKQMPGMMFQVV